MFLLETFKVSFLFLLIFIGVVNIGRISNKLIFKKENYVETNIILGLISLSFLIGIALSLKIFDLPFDCGTQDIFMNSAYKKLNFLQV